MTSIRHELKMNRKSLLIWAITIGAMIYSFLLLFPQMEEQMKDISDMYGQMGSFSTAFGMDKLSMATAVGYYGIEVGAVLALGGSMFAAIIGIGMLAKEEGGHTTEFLYVMPKSRCYFISNKLIAATVLILIFNVLCYLCGILGFVSIGEEIAWKSVTMFHLAQTIMHIQICYLCFGVSAFLKKNNIGLGIGIAVILYFLNIFANVTDKMKFLAYLSPFHYADASNVMISKSIEVKYLLVGVLIGIAGVITAFIKYNRKDLVA